MSKLFKITLNSLPLLVMVGMIPLIKNDYYLALAFLVIIILSLLAKREKHDGTILLFGFVAMVFFEYLFVSTGVEYFVRNSLFGIMPVWLPVLWAYGFVGIKRSVTILNS
jgi:hypothetical protein